MKRELIRDVLAGETYDRDVVIAGWVQLFSLMEAEGLPGLLAPPRGLPAR